MTDLIREHKELVIFAGLGLILTVAIGLTMSDLRAPPVFAATATQTVYVTATVQEWLSFTVSPTSTALSPDLVNSAGVTAIGSSTNITLTLGSNASSGWSITIRGANAGLATGTFDLIESVATGATASTTLTATYGDGYGANATTVLSDASIGAPYSHWGSAWVGAIASSTSQVLVSKGTPNSTSTDAATMKIYATCDNLQPAGTYADTVTLTATSIP